MDILQFIVIFVYYNAAMEITNVSFSDICRIFSLEYAQLIGHRVDAI